MKAQNKSIMQTNLSIALAHLLGETIPTKASTAHLEDIVNALMESLTRGAIYLPITKTIPPIELNANGWPEDHLSALRNSGWLGEDNSPIVLEENRLSWKRWDSEMKSVIKELIKKSTIHPDIGGAQEGENHARSYKNLNPEQLLAVKAITNQNVILISGGPGTGKTSTIAQMLIELISIKPLSKIGLAAPTGKASRRLQETLETSFNGVEQDYRSKLKNVPCQTLHKWLKAKDDGFAKNKLNQLELDLLVIDEMSMVDLNIMKGVLNALPNNSQLVLVGDPNQLPPIGPGAVWNELQSDSIRLKFKKSSITLNKLYRNRGEIAKLAKTLKENDFRNFWESVHKMPASSNVDVHLSNKKELPSFIHNKLVTHQIKLKQLVKQNRQKIENELREDLFSKTNTFTEISKEIIKTLEELIVLSPKKFGLWSVQHIHRSILGEKLDAGVRHWPEGTPVICGENQPELGLANGDIGVIIGNGESAHLLFIVISEYKELTPLIIQPERLRTIDPAFALTIHKAQGSEAKEVILLWPNEIYFSNSKIPIPRNPQYEKSLMYTAVTRAKSRLSLIFPENEAIKSSG